jgi:AcrR family transcriptional regulator
MAKPMPGYRDHRMPTQKNGKRTLSRKTVGRQPAALVPSPGNRQARDFNPEIRSRLETAVLDVFSNSDFHKANMRTVAKLAGVSFSTIYNHYGSKEGLLFAFVDEKLYELTERMIDHLQGIEDLKERLRKVFWVQLDYYERNPEVGRILFMTVPMKTWMSDATFQQRKMINIFLEALCKGQKEGILTAEVRASVLLDFMHGLVQRSFFMWIHRKQAESLSEQANVLFEMVWRAISNSKPVGNR